MWTLALALLVVFAAYKVVRRLWRRRPTAEEALLVTGCDGGFGFRFVESLVANTDAQVYAGCVTKGGMQELEKLAERTKSTALGHRVFPLKMDITKDTEVDAAFEAIAKSGKVLRGVVNNAGLGCYGWCEALSMERYEYNMQVNYLGTVRVTKKALPLLRRSKGRLVMIGSAGARMPSAFGSGYLPTKAALYSFQDCVRQEVYKFGMKVSVVEPGFFATGMLQKAAVIGEDSKEENEELNQAYGSFAAKMKESEAPVMASEKLNGGEKGCATVVDAVLDALTAVYPKASYVVGYDAMLLARLSPFVPCWLMDPLRLYLI